MPPATCSRTSSSAPADPTGMALMLQVKLIIEEADQDLVLNMKEGLVVMTKEAEHVMRGR